MKQKILEKLSIRIKDYQQVPTYFKIEKGKINKEGIRKLSSLNLKKAYKYWYAFRESYSRSSKDLLVLSVLVASLKKELDRRENLKCKKVEVKINIIK